MRICVLYVFLACVSVRACVRVCACMCMGAPACVDVCGLFHSRCNIMALNEIKFQMIILYPKELNHGRMQCPAVVI